MDWCFLFLIALSSAHAEVFDLSLIKARQPHLRSQHLMDAFQLSEEPNKRTLAHVLENLGARQDVLSPTPFNRLVGCMRAFGFPAPARLSGWREFSLDGFTDRVVRTALFSGEDLRSSIEIEVQKYLAVYSRTPMNFGSQNLVFMVTPEVLRPQFVAGKGSTFWNQDQFIDGGIDLMNAVNGFLERLPAGRFPTWERAMKHKVFFTINQWWWKDDGTLRLELTLYSAHRPRKIRVDRFLDQSYPLQAKFAQREREIREIVPGLEHAPHIPAEVIFAVVTQMGQLNSRGFDE